MIYRLNIGSTLVNVWFKISVKHRLVSAFFYMGVCTKGTNQSENFGDF